MKRILISGANGFVGTNLRRHLDGQAEIVTLDVADADYGWNELGEIPWGTIDAVVHLAGKAHDLRKVADEQCYFDINVGLTEKLMASIRTAAVNARLRTALRFIYFSSIKAADGDTPYARSKKAAEEFLRATARQFGDAESRPIEVCILRPAMIHGPGNKGNLNLLWGIARRGLPWPLAAFENLRSFTSIGNICAVVRQLALLPDLSPMTESLGIYPVCDDEPLSTNRIIELMGEAGGHAARLWRLPCKLMRLAARCGDVLHLPLNTERLGKLTEDLVVDNAAVKSLLGWKKMPVPAEDGLRMTLRSFANSTAVGNHASKRA